jgi:putative membrane protein
MPVSVNHCHSHTGAGPIYLFSSAIDARYPGSGDNHGQDSSPGAIHELGGRSSGRTGNAIGNHAAACGLHAGMYLLSKIPWKDGHMRIVIRVLITAGALALAAALVPGIEVRTGSALEKAGTLIVVALIFGIVNAILKPIVKTVGCLFYVLTLGLIALVVNALLLWLTSWVAGKLSLPFHITGFWPAFWGAIIVGVVGWLLNLSLDEDRQARRQARQHF